MKTLLVIPNNKKDFYNAEKFNDTYYISLKFKDNFEKELQKRIKELDKKEFDVIFIKESLGPTCLDFTGIKLAWYIRLLSNKHKFKPIIILSNFDAVLIKKITFLGDILFTQGVYLIDEFIEGRFTPLKDYKNFINLVKIPLPLEYNSNHDLSNDWALYVWAKNFDVKMDKLFIKFEEKFYFQYLKAKYELEVKKQKVELKNQNLKILAIDDKKEWGEIYKKVEIEFYNIQDCKFNENIIEDYDMIILDLRLRKEDYKKEQKIQNYYSYKLVERFLQTNPAVWIVIFSSSKNAEIIQEFKKFPNVIDYIKKNHPEDKENNILDSINKFNKAFAWVKENKYLKEIWQIKREIEDILEQINFEKEIINELKIANELVFYNLTCNENKKKFEYAMLAIYKILEIIKDYFIKQDYKNKKKLFIKKPFNKSIDFIINDNLEIENNDDTKQFYFNSTAHKLKLILYYIDDKKLYDNKFLYDFFKEIAFYRNGFVHPDKSKSNTFNTLNSSLIIRLYKNTYQFLLKIASF